MNLLLTVIVTYSNLLVINYQLEKGKKEEKNKKNNKKKRRKNKRRKEEKKKRKEGKEKVSATLYNIITVS